MAHGESTLIRIPVLSLYMFVIHMFNEYNFDKTWSHILFPSTSDGIDVWKLEIDGQSLDSYVRYSSSDALL